MVERIDERQGGGAVEGPTVVEGGGDADRGLVGGRNAEIWFTHCGRVDVGGGEGRRGGGSRA